MSKMLRKRLIPAEFLVASSLLLAPGLALTGYGQNSPPSTAQTTPTTATPAQPRRHAFGYSSRGVDSARPGD